MNDIDMISKKMANIGYFAICQDHDILLGIDSFSFDLSDNKFVKYFMQRTGIQLDLSKENDNFLEHENNYILKCRLQDCWIIYEMKKI